MEAARVRFLEDHENTISSKGDWCLSKRLLKKSGTISATCEKKASYSNKVVVSGVSRERNISPYETYGSPAGTESTLGATVQATKTSHLVPSRQLGERGCATS